MFVIYHFDTYCRLFQAQLGLHLSSEVGGKGGGDVGNAGSNLHDVDVAAFLAYGLDGVENFGGDGLHLLSLCLLKSLVVVLASLEDTLVEVVKFLVATSLDVLGQGGLFFLKSLGFLLQLVLHLLQVGLILFCEFLYLCASSIILGHGLNDFL